MKGSVRYTIALTTTAVLLALFFISTLTHNQPTGKIYNDYPRALYTGINKIGKKNPLNNLKSDVRNNNDDHVKNNFGNQVNIGYVNNNIKEKIVNHQSYNLTILKHSDWKSKYFCDTNCTSGVPCEYKDEVNFRIIVIVANRPDSLQKCIKKVTEIDMMGDRLAVDIWIDMLKDGSIHEGTRKVAEAFTKSFTNGRACYHIQNQHSFIANQWINTYRPKPGTKEVAMILEDDIDVSHHVWKWYKALHNHFRSATNIAGYSLKMKGANLRAIGKTNIPIKAPKDHTIVLYNCFQAWGYSPQPSVWREFQDWYHKVRTNKNKGDIVKKVDSLIPKVPGSKHFEWWSTFKKKNFQESMAHEMWNIYFTNIYKKNLFTVYSNLQAFTGRNDVKLCVNREEKGLHYSGHNVATNSSKELLYVWHPRYVQFPSKPYKLSITGQHI